MFRRIAYLFLLSLLMGCTKEAEILDSRPIQLEAQIAEAETRTSMSGSTASFTSGDKIGLFETLTGLSNRSYTYNGTTWSASSSAYWRNDSSTHTFYAYYPYQSSVSGTKVSIPVLSSQSIGVSPNSNIDLLVAGPLSQTRSANVGLTFTHALSLIQLNIKMGILGLLNPYDLQSITITGGNLSTSSSPYGIANKSNNPSDIGYDLTTKKIVADNNTSDRFTQSFTRSISGVTILYTAVTLYIFVLPGTYTAPVPAVSFKVALLGIAATTSSVTFSNTTFAAGTKYVYDVSIGNKILGAPAVTLIPRAITPID